MLVSFSLENWMSFRNPVTFSMVASKERQHGHRIPKIRKYQTRVLPVAVLYGGNASGKTNFFKALSFAQNLIIKGTQPDSLIPVEPFRLDAASSERPSRFQLELLIDERMYEFSFAVTRKAVLEEKLVAISGTSEKVLYHRRDGEPNFDASLAKEQFLRFAFQGTRDNQLFLTNSVSQKVDEFLPVYDWFKDTLRLIAPDSYFTAFERFFDEEDSRYATMGEMLSQLDTGIAHLGGEEISLENLPFPDSLKTKLQETVKEGKAARWIGPNGERLVVARKNGALSAKKLVTYHPRTDGTEIKFDVIQESDGSQRLFELLPAFLELSTKSSKSVFIIDEIDRSLHTLLTRKLLDTYLTNCSSESRTQLLMTTHDVLLMDQQLLRRDEMWVSERDNSGSSTLFSFSEYKDVRYDKDIRKSYLQGRLGGIPRILLGGSLTVPCLAEESEGDD